MYHNKLSKEQAKSLDGIEYYIDVVSKQLGDLLKLNSEEASLLVKSVKIFIKATWND